MQAPQGRSVSLIEIISASTHTQTHTTPYSRLLQPDTMGQKPQTIAPAAHASWAPSPLLIVSGSLFPSPPHTLSPRKKKAAQNQQILHWRHTRLHLHQLRIPATPAPVPAPSVLHPPPSAAQPRCCLWEGSLSPQLLSCWEDLETQLPQDGLRFLRNDAMS